MANIRAIRGETTPIRMPLDEIGGGRVISPYWTYRNGQRVYVQRGTMLSADEIRAMNPANRSSLLGRFIAVWPKASPAEFVASRTAVASAERPERHVVALGFGRYDVIEGVKINDTALDRAAAYALADKPEPEKKRA